MILKVRGSGDVVLTAAIDHGGHPESTEKSISGVQVTATRPPRCRGKVYGAHASGNAVALLGNCFEALLLGYRVAVCPSRRGPFITFSPVSALHAAERE